MCVRVYHVCLESVYHVCECMSCGVYNMCVSVYHTRVYYVCECVSCV